MPLELRPGVVIPIPCRQCSKSMLRFTLAEGVHTLSCAKCGGATDVQVYQEGGAWKVKTGPARGKPSRPSGQN